MDIGNQFSGSDYDYRKYDRIWQRVAPDLDPYPEVRQAMAGGAMSVRAEDTLPGAEENPCCMGTAAMESLEVLDGFIEEELADRRYFLAFARKAPTMQAARVLRDMAASAGEHARRLSAVHYLITGQCYQQAIVCEKLCIRPWCAALRESYHKAACNGMNYIRASEGTTDPCLAKLLKDLSDDEYRHADQLLTLLERSLRQNSSCGSC